MCGLVGIAGDTTGTWKDVFNELLIVDVVRGPHSTGAGFVGRTDNKFMLAKRLGDPFNLLRCEDYEKAMAFANPQRVLIGHNRSATIGGKTEENAHPFMFDNIIGAHNGTLDKFCIKDLSNHDKYETDSQAIFATIEDKGIEAAIKEMSGAWALTYFDKRDKTFNMIRNNKRPLHYTYSEDRTTLIWASEFEMIEYVLRRRKKSIQKDGKGQNQIFSLPIDHLYSWHIPEIVTGKIETPTSRKIEGRAWVSTYGVPFVPGKTKKTGTDYHTDHKGLTIFSSFTPFEKRKSSKKFRHPYRDCKNKIVNKVNFEFMVEEGCVFCNANGQKFGEFVNILGPYVDYKTPYMCEECYNSPEQYNIAQYAI